jgi:cytochrome c biogenesis protein CcmG/thiol:disulfide interchange protein DsbE
LFTLEPGDAKFSPVDLQGQVWMLNVWATWCVACREEHPVLVAFSEKNQVPIVGLSYKEIQPQDPAYKSPFDEKLKLARERSQLWLKRHGNPYITTVMDLDGRVGINYGVYGVPETYVIDKGGVIRYKFVGAVSPALLAEKILPLIAELNKS